MTVSTGTRNHLHQVRGIPATVAFDPKLGSLHEKPKDTVALACANAGVSPLHLKVMAERAKRLNNQSNKKKGKK